MAKIDVWPIENGNLHISIPPEHIAAFKKLIFRGNNTWDQAPPAIKIMRDELIHGKVLQDYESQDSSAADSLSKDTK